VLSVPGLMLVLALFLAWVVIPVSLLVVPLLLLSLGELGGNEAQSGFLSSLFYPVLTSVSALFCQF